MVGSLAQGNATWLASGERKIFPPLLAGAGQPENYLSPLSAAWDVMTCFQSFLMMGFLIGIWKTAPKSWGLDGSPCFISKSLNPDFQKDFYTSLSGKVPSATAPIPPKLPTWGLSSHVCFPIYSLDGSTSLPPVLRCVCSPGLSSGSPWQVNTWAAVLWEAVLDNSQEWAKPGLNPCSSMLGPWEADLSPYASISLTVKQ